jgi:hypothetical protein
MRMQTVQAYAASAIDPPIIDCPSTAAKGAPFVETVMRSVANAIEGAAPNSPAKLLGRKTSAKAEKAETARPPARKRRRYSATLLDPFLLDIAFSS